MVPVPLNPPAPACARRPRARGVLLLLLLLLLLQWVVEVLLQLQLQLLVLVLVLMLVLVLQLLLVVLLWSQHQVCRCRPTVQRGASCAVWSKVPQGCGLCRLPMPPSPCCCCSCRCRCRCCRRQCCPCPAQDWHSRMRCWVRGSSSSRAPDGHGVERGEALPKVAARHHEHIIHAQPRGLRGEVGTGRGGGLQGQGQGSGGACGVRCASEARRAGSCAPTWGTLEAVEPRAPPAVPPAHTELQATRNTSRLYAMAVAASKPSTPPTAPPTAALGPRPPTPPHLVAGHQELQPAVRHGRDQHAVRALRGAELRPLPRPVWRAAHGIAKAVPPPHQARLALQQQGGRVAGLWCRRAGREP